MLIVAHAIDGSYQGEKAVATGVHIDVDDVLLIGFTQIAIGHFDRDAFLEKLDQLHFIFRSQFPAWQAGFCNQNKYLVFIADLFEKRVLVTHKAKWEQVANEVEVWINPNRPELNSAFRKSQYHFLRGIVSDRQLFVWDANEALHDDMEYWLSQNGMIEGEPKFWINLVMGLQMFGKEDFSGWSGKPHETSGVYWMASGGDNMVSKSPLWLSALGVANAHP